MIERDLEKVEEARKRAWEDDPARHEREQRDYILGITSLWMLVPAAHGLAGLGDGVALMTALQTLSWQGNPYMLDPAE